MFRLLILFWTIMSRLRLKTLFFFTSPCEISEDRVFSSQIMFETLKIKTLHFRKPEYFSVSPGPHEDIPLLCLYSYCHYKTKQKVKVCQDLVQFPSQFEYIWVLIKGKFFFHKIIDYLCIFWCFFLVLHIFFL